ncbi:hypothetical protein GGF32_005734 [Allomyces javanicus]|nr:hypothetical protein GGF32_005734 [Allomyces javanicus]
MDRRATSSKKSSSAATSAQSEWDALKAMMASGFGKSVGASRNQTNTSKATRPTTTGDSDDEEEREAPQRRGGRDDKPTLSIPSSSAAPARKERDEKDQEDDDDDDDFVGPPPPPADAAAAGSDDDDDQGDDTDDNPLPLTNEVHMQGHSRAVTALDVDPSGARCITGSLDYTIRMYDFAAMDANLRAFKSLEPMPGHQILDVQWSTTGDSFLLAPHAPQVRLYDRDGVMRHEYAKGDMYLRDLRNTDGHTGTVTAVRWRPGHKQTFATSSFDSTIRIWDVERPRKQAHVIVFKHGTGARGIAAKSPVSTLAYSRDGNYLAGGAEDGSIRIWKAQGPYSTAAFQHHTAHASGNLITSLAFAWDQHTLLSRSMDETVKLWDLRNFKHPIHTHAIPTVYPTQNAVFSPDDQRILAGWAVPPSRKQPATTDDASGELRVLDRASFDLVTAVKVGGGGAVRVVWHPKLHQILVGTARGATAVMYRPGYSQRGVTLCVSRAPRVRTVEDDVADLVMEKASEVAVDWKTVGKRQRDGKAKPMPERQKRAPTMGGGSLFDAKNVVDLRAEDPREAILKYADVAAKNPYWVAPAYSATQPKAVLAEKVVESDEEERVIDAEDRQRAKRRRM